MHIALLNCYDMSNSHGGVERVFCNFANRLVECGHTVTAIAFDPRPGEPVFPLKSTVHFENVAQKTSSCPPPQFIKAIDNLRSIVFHYRNRKKQRFFYPTRRYARQIQHVLAHRPAVDLWIAFQAQTAYAVTLLGHHAPMILMVHGHPQGEDFLQRIGQALTSVTVTQTLLPSYVKYLKPLLPSHTPIEVIGNAVPIFNGKNDRTQKIVATVMRVVRAKRPDLLIDAFSQIHARYPDWQLQIWGPCTDPAYAQALDKTIKAHGLTHAIHLMGPTQDVEGVLANASIFAFPSSTEGFPLALTEAMSKGLAVIGCEDCEAVRCLVQDQKSGAIVQPTAAAFAAALATLMDSESTRRQWGDAAQQAMLRYRPELIEAAWFQLIDRVTRS